MDRPKITKDFKFRIGAHMAPTLRNVPEDCIFRHELHEDAKCSYESCTCMCPDCVMARNEEADHEKPERGSLDYQDLVQIIIENQDTAKRVK